MVEEAQPTSARNLFPSQQPEQQQQATPAAQEAEGNENTITTTTATTTPARKDKGKEKIRDDEINEGTGKETESGKETNENETNQGVGDGETTTTTPATAMETPLSSVRRGAGFRPGTVSKKKALTFRTCYHVSQEADYLVLEDRFDAALQVEWHEGKELEAFFHNNTATTNDAPESLAEGSEEGGEEGGESASEKPGVPSGTWYRGTVLSSSPMDDQFPESHWESLNVRWATSKTPAGGKDVSNNNNILNNTTTEKVKGEGQGVGERQREAEGEADEDEEEDDYAEIFDLSGTLGRSNQDSSRISPWEVREVVTTHDGTPSDTFAKVLQPTLPPEGTLSLSFSFS